MKLTIALIYSTLLAFCVVKLESTRYDVSMYDYPDTTWEFYETFLGCDITQLGIQKGEPTTADIDEEDGKTEKFIRKAVKTRKEAMIPVITPKEEPPEPYRSLMYLVQQDGRWNNLKVVKKVLHLPRHARLTSTTQEWEAATGFALAAIRQAYEYFHLLGDIFDKGTNWMTNEVVLYEAKRVLNDLQYHAEIPGYESPVEEVEVEEEEDEDSLLALRRQEDSIAEGSTEEARDAFGNVIPLKSSGTKDGDEPGGGMTMTNAPATPGTPSLAESLRAITPQVDQRKRARVDKQINDILNDIFTMSTDLDMHRGAIEDLLKSSVVAYNAAETHTERTYVFLELTAMIGNGELARKGLPPDDWRSKGVIGYRPKVMSLLAKVAELADARLELEEIELPGGRSANAATEYVPAGNKYRWTVVWDGDDIVAKVLHSLDFLRDAKDFRMWYGRTYLFLCNPLGLAFDIGNSWDSLGMDEKVNEHIMTRPHFRHVKFTEHDWQHQKYLWKWKEKLLELSEGRWGWWPGLPELKLESDQHKLYVAMLILLIKCREEMIAFSQYEGEMVSFESTARGAGVGPKGTDIRDLVFFMPKRGAPPEEDDLEADYAGVDLPEDLEKEAQARKVVAEERKKKKHAATSAAGSELSAGTDKKPPRVRGVQKSDKFRRASVQNMAKQAHSNVQGGIPKGWKNLANDPNGTQMNAMAENVIEEQHFKEGGDEKALRAVADAAGRGPVVRLRKASTMEVSTKDLRLMGKSRRRSEVEPMVRPSSRSKATKADDDGLNTLAEGSISSKGSSKASSVKSKRSTVSSVKASGAADAAKNDTAPKSEDDEAKKPTSAAKGKRRGSRRASAVGPPKGKKSEQAELLLDKEKLTEALMDSRAVARTKPEMEGRRMTKRGTGNIR